MGRSPSLSERIREEFRQMPGLKLTVAQACRLWSLNETLCRQVLEELIAEGFLFQTPSGAFIAVPSAVRMARAALREMRSFRCPYCQHLNSVADEPPRSTITLRCSACTRVVTQRPQFA